MNNKILAFFALAIVCIFAYSSGLQEKQLSKIELDAYNGVNEAELVAYLDDFIEEAANHAIHLDGAKSRNIQISFTNLNYGRVMGISWEMNNNESVVINIMASSWKNMSDAKKKYLMFHELGHDLLNLPHETTPMMKANLPQSPSMEITNQHIKQMFEYHVAIHGYGYIN